MNPTRRPHRPLCPLPRALLIALLSVGLALPRPAFALRQPTVEGSGLEELKQTLAPSSPAASATTPHPAAGMEEKFKAGMRVRDVRYPSRTEGTITKVWSWDTVNILFDGDRVPQEVSPDDLESLGEQQVPQPSDVQEVSQLLRQLKRLAGVARQATARGDSTGLSKVIAQIQDAHSRLTQIPMWDLALEPSQCIQTGVALALALPVANSVYDDTTDDTTDDTETPNGVREQIQKDLLRGLVIDLFIDNHERVETNLRQITGALRTYVTSLDAKAWSTLRLGGAVVVEPWKNLEALRKTQEQAGNLELAFSVIRSSGGPPVVIFSLELEGIAVPRLGSFATGVGHTHGFNTPLEASETDTDSATEVREFGLDQSDFIVAFDRSGRVELAWFENGQWQYERSNQRAIARKLRTFGLLSSTTGLEEQTAQAVAVQEIQQQFQAAVEAWRGDFETTPTVVQNQGVVLAFSGAPTVAEVLRQARVPVLVVEPDAVRRAAMAYLLGEPFVAETVEVALDRLQTRYGISHPIIVTNDLVLAATPPRGTVVIPVADAREAVAYLQQLEFLPNIDPAPLLEVALDEAKYLEQIQRYYQ